MLDVSVVPVLALTTMIAVLVLVRWELKQTERNLRATRRRKMRAAAGRA